MKEMLSPTSMVMGAGLGQVSQVSNTSAGLGRVSK
jgi:hypothetical protein